MNQVPLLNESAVDVDTLLSTEPAVLRVTHPSLVGGDSNGVVFDTDFAVEQLPEWLDVDTDNGSHSFDGVSSGNDNTNIDLSTGTVSNGDATVVSLSASDGSPGSINWDNWSEVHVYAVFDSTPANATSMIAFGNDKDANDLSEGFVVSDNNGDLFLRANSGGSSVNSAKALGRSEPTSFGFSIVEGEGNNGHTVSFYAQGELVDSLAEGQGFPAANSYGIHAGVSTNSTVSDRTASLDRFLVILVP